MRDWLVAIRKERGMTQKYVAEKIGLAQASYCTIEKGRTNPTVNTAKAIAAVLGFDWTLFYEDEKEVG